MSSLFTPAELADIHAQCSATMPPDASEKVRVYARPRPVNEREKHELQCSKASATAELKVSGATVSVKWIGSKAKSNTGGKSKSKTVDKFHLDGVADEEEGKGGDGAAEAVGSEDPRAAQKRVFFMVGLPQVAAALNGFNATIFAYGQTGSGKVGGCCS